MQRRMALCEGGVGHALELGVERLVALQAEDGSWSGPYGGPMFLLPMYVAACHIAGREIPAARRAGMTRGLRQAIQPTGGIGLHLEAPGTVFTTAINYVALRLLDLPPQDPDLGRMRRWLGDHGTPLYSAPWGKMLLALLGLYEYDGLHPVLPELWLLPSRLAIHPSHMWCHSRQVYLPMAWLYGTRARGPESAIIRELRRELYDRPYETIRFREYRDAVAATDRQVASSWLLDLGNAAMDAVERRHSQRLRQRALARLVEHIEYEDRTTGFVRLGPVNAVLNTLVHCFREPGSELVRRSFEGLEAYLLAEPAGDADSEGAERATDGPGDGRRVSMKGYNSTALWDTAFASQAILATPLAARHRLALERAYANIVDQQIPADPPQHRRFFRHPTAGGWPFSDRQQGWPTSDCTAEGLRSALHLGEHLGRGLPPERVEAAVRRILSWQNPDGGWPTYERQRAGRWLERLNPSHIFADIMVDYSYVECTSACMQALAETSQRLSGRLGRQARHALRRGERFLRAVQRPDGSWEGCWGVCFTYGTWFGVSGLRAVGASPADPALRAACRFLETTQRGDGGWGEHYTSCTARCYIAAADGQVVRTAWALLALVRAGAGSSDAARRAVEFLLGRQQPDGDWPAEPMAGVFNKTTLIDYDNYRRYFPVWALAEQARAEPPRS